MDKKQIVVDLVKSIETRSTEPISYVNPQKFINHNLGAEDGLEGIGKMLQQLPPNSAKANTVRVFQDGDFVVAHSDVNFFGPKVGFDIFRFEDGKIVEHWDNLQEKPPMPNPGGHTMIDGSTEIKDRDQTEANKAVAKGAIEDLIINGRMDKLPQYFNGDELINHSPDLADGVSGMGKGMAERAASGRNVQYDTIHMVLGEGNFALVVGEGTVGGKPTAFYDLFRMENGKLAEHWDVLQDIPPKSAWKNNNGKF